MKLTRTLSLVTFLSLLLAACNQESTETSGGVKANTNPLLAHAPADTAYVFAALEPIPDAITDAYLARFQPVLDVISKQTLQFQGDYESGSYDNNQIATLAMAVLEELGGTISAESLEKLGISMQSHHAVYAMGIFPVIRFGLSDAQALRNAISRIETKMDFELPEQELNGTAYWRLAEEGMPVAFYIAILDQQLAISAFPLNAEDKLLAAFLGQEMPAESIASTNALAIMNRDKGYSGYGSGFLDLKKLAAEFLDPDSATRGYLSTGSKFQFPELDVTCRAEVNSIIETTPRMTAGTTKITSDEISIRYDLEIKNSLAVGLASLVSDTPVAIDGDHLLSGSLAIQVGKLRSFMLEKADAIVAAPYQCAMLQELNRDATELATQLNVPMPPMINNILGARILVADFDPSGGMTEGSGLLAVHVEKPEMFVGMASMVIPEFEDLDLANQSEPVRVPAGMLHMEDIEVFALMSDNAIGASIGEHQSSGLAAFMAAKPQDSGTFFSITYDLARQWELKAMSPDWNIDTTGPTSPDHELSEAIRKSYVSMLGRSRIDMHFTDSGLVIDSRMTFK